MDCPQHPDGHVCTRTGPHTMHRAQLEWSWATWGEPDPVAQYIKPKKKKGQGASDAEILEGIARVTNAGPRHPSDSPKQASGRSV